MKSSQIESNASHHCLPSPPPIHLLNGWPSREGSHPNPLKIGSNCKLFHFSNHILSLSAIWRAQYMHPLFIALIWQCRNFLNFAFSDYCFQAGIPITCKGGRTSILQQEILFTVFPKLENYLHLICGVVEDSTKQSNFLLNIIYRFLCNFWHGGISIIQIYSEITFPR